MILELKIGRNSYKVLGIKINYTPKNYPKSCTRIKNHTKVKMGYFWKQAKKGIREAYTVEVRKTAPFCTKIKPQA